MVILAEIDKLKGRNLCYRCVGEAYLRAEMRRGGRRRRCSYCQRIGRSYTVAEMAERIEGVFEEHFCRTLDQPNSWQQTLLSDRESDYEWERDGEPVVDAIMNAADMPQQTAEDIQAVLEEEHSDFDAAAMGEETEFSSDSYYEEKGANDRAWQEEWNEFERSLKTKARFFSRAAAQHLKFVFDGIETMSSTDGRPLVIDAGPETGLTTIYRARVFQSDDRLIAALCEPDVQLGSPPANLARAGRMNAQGISVFYGADEACVAVAEVRPPVGSQVAVAAFDIVQRVRLLDLTALRSLSEGGSLFDPALGSRMERAMFLRSLSQRITRPVMPDDEAFDYLPTQAIADFLATENEPPIDGILFPSAQAVSNAVNVVLFQKASRVAAIEIPIGTEVDAQTGQMYEEGWEVEYRVIEWVPAPQPPAEEEAEVETHGRPKFASFAGALWTPPDSDFREATLRIDLDSINIHVVQRVIFETDEYRVMRHRWVKRDTDPGF